MRATIYLRKKELENYIEKRGYNIKTIRIIILKEFGFKNSNEFKNEYKNLSSSVLNIKLAYKNLKEYESILVLISDLLAFLKNSLKKEYFKRIFGSEVLFYDINSYTNGLSRLNYDFYRENKSLTLYNFTISSVFRKEFLNEIKEKTDLNEIYLSI